MGDTLHITQEPTEIDFSKALKLKAAVKYEPHNLEGLAVAIQTFGLIRPIYITRNTWRVLNPLDLQALELAGRFGMEIPDRLPAVLVTVDESLEAALSLVINGGLDAWLSGIPEDKAVIETIFRLMDIHPEKLLILGPPLDYFQLVLDNMAGNAPEKPTAAPRTSISPDSPTLSLDIPLLDPEKQITRGYTFTAWGQQRRAAQIEAAHFYVDDYRFQQLLSKPEMLIDAGAAAAIEINFSTSDTQPGALFYADLWKKRKLSTDWQKRGINIAVDLNVSGRYLSASLTGVPAGWKAYANRAYDDDLEHLEIAHEIARTHAGGDVLYLIYSGGRRAKDLCAARGWRHIGDINGSQTLSHRAV
jgi:hypothetical protein